VSALDLPAVKGRRDAPLAKRLLAQSAAEVGTTLRRGESLLLTIGIPVVLLVFFSSVKVLPTGTRHPVDFLAPGIMSLAVMSTAMVNLSIATGFERSYGFLKRLGATPLGRPALIGAKAIAVLAVEILQLVLLGAAAYGLGWNENGSLLAALGVVLLATLAFAAIGMLLAGTLRAEANLAASNGLWLVLLLVSGMLVPLHKLPGWMAGASRLLPSAALASALHDTLSAGRPVPSHDWLVLFIWALAASAAAARWFRFE
jgi:ABC-2 type transport system permease protein